MANFRRNKPRLRTYGRSRDKHGNPDYQWMANWPAWHDRVFHVRLSRRAHKAIADAFRGDKLDFDGAVLPLDKRPHTYYW